MLKVLTFERLKFSIQLDNLQFTLYSLTIPKMAMTSSSWMTSSDPDTTKHRVSTLSPAWKIRSPGAQWVVWNSTASERRQPSLANRNAGCSLNTWARGQEVDGYYLLLQKQHNRRLPTQDYRKTWLVLVWDICLFSGERNDSELLQQCYLQRCASLEFYTSNQYLNYLSLTSRSVFVHLLMMLAAKNFKLSSSIFCVVSVFVWWRWLGEFA